MATVLDLHALANSREMARPFLEREGLLLGDDPTQPLWHVTIIGTVTVQTTMQVHAASKREAEGIASGRVERDPPDEMDWEWGATDWNEFLASEA